VGSMDRRSFIEVSAAAALAGAGSTLAVPQLRTPPAAGSIARGLTPGFYRFKLGDFNVTVLGDGSFQLPSEILGANVPEDQLGSYLESWLVPLDFFTLAANPAVIDTGGQLILVDTGSGSTGDPEQTTGYLMASLAAAGIAAEAVNTVILTHAHPDHLGELINPDTGALRFPNAEVVLSDTEHAFWAAPDVAERVPGWVIDFGIVAQNHAVFAALGDRIRTVPMQGEIVSGIHSLPSPGHTPGHIALLVSAGGDELIMVGDALFTQHTHFEHPEWRVAFDLDQGQGARTRRRLLDRIVADRLLVQGFHLPFPGVGHAVRHGDAYRWVPTV
jgi:glyoxylase-like metal-dependent hydrolase (beta-lactamase superfamily II)